ncbi:hypothetical protein Tco_0352914 [Tanacetum coccineum]
MSANDNFSLHDDEELSLHDDASLDGSVPASNKGDAPAKPPQIMSFFMTCTLCLEVAPCYLSAAVRFWGCDKTVEPDEQELEAHYMYMSKIQEVLHAADDNSGPTYDVEPLENTDRNIIPDSSNMCDNKGKVDQTVDEHENERVMLASLIANLKLDVDEN